MDEAFAQDLESINWFASCGQPISSTVPFPVTIVDSWTVAIELCSKQSWEDFTLEAQNRLTEFLHNYHRSAYQSWNTIVITAKERIVNPLTNRIWRPFSEEHGFGKVMVDCVSWDVLGAIMEHEYRYCSDRPEFFKHLLQIYRAGHFPCGWNGDWPTGDLLVW
jgi:hypothetical protein